MDYSRSSFSVLARKKTIFVTALIALGLIGISGPAHAQSEIVESKSGSLERTAAFRTRAARLAVPPVDWDEARGDVQQSDSPSESRTTGPVGFVPGGLPEPDADTKARRKFRLSWKAQQSEPNSATYDLTRTLALNEQRGTKNVFAQYCENCSGVNKSFPQRAIGKLFYKNNGKSYTCSASVISKKNVIVTAGHCCYNRSSKKASNSFVFYPAYRNGYAPYGGYNWSSRRYLTGWKTTGKRQYDVCVIKLKKNIWKTTGYLGRSWNYGTTQLHHALGYPSNIGSGKKLELCVAESNSQHSSCEGSKVYRMGCNMMSGSSGGPWIRSYRRGNYVNSVVSGWDSTKCTGTYKKNFNGARFTSANIVLLCSGGYC